MRALQYTWTRPPRRTRESHRRVLTLAVPCLRCRMAGNTRGCSFDLWAGTQPTLGV